jgi:hypothetical protein
LKFTEIHWSLDLVLKFTEIHWSFIVPSFISKIALFASDQFVLRFDIVQKNTLIAFSIRANERGYEARKNNKNKGGAVNC